MLLSLPSSPSLDSAPLPPASLLLLDELLLPPEESSSSGVLVSSWLDAFELPPEDGEEGGGRSALTGAAT